MSIKASSFFIKFTILVILFKSISASFSINNLFNKFTSLNILLLRNSYFANTFIKKSSGPNKKVYIKNLITVFLNFNNNFKSVLINNSFFSFVSKQKRFKKRDEKLLTNKL